MRAYWAWAVIALSACLDRSPCSGTSHGRNASSAEAEEACADWATRYCNRLAFCAPISVQIGYGDVARCIVRNGPLCSSALLAHGSGATPSSVATCARAYDSASCDDVVVARPAQACNVQGSLPIGAVCGDNAQCAGPNGYCRIDADQTCGTCATLGAIGADCDSARDCEYGLVCFFSCIPPVAQGAACDGMTRQCPETLVCFNYTCSPPAQLGGKCDHHADNCDHDHGLLCDAHEHVCSLYAVAEVGAPCDAATTCKGGRCVTNSATQTSICMANAVDGASCDSKEGPGCSAPARCVNGTCRVPDVSTCHET
jgi:hypothetical protein